VKKKKITKFSELGGSGSLTSPLVTFFSTDTISFMVGLKRRDSSNSSIFKHQKSFCQKLQFENVQDLYLTTDTIPSTTSTTLQEEEEGEGRKRARQQQSHTKYVHFLTTTNIIEIPSRYDYVEAGINLWWSANDIKAFHRDFLLSCPSR
jgi:hypothetical protein